MTVTAHRQSGLAAVLVALACETTNPSSEGADIAEGAEAEDEGTESDAGSEGGDPIDGQECHDALEKGSATVGQPCSTNEACESHVCETFETVPAPPGGVCGQTPSGCRSRIMGTVRDVLTSIPVPGAHVSLMPGIDASAGVDLAPRLLEETSDGNGHIDSVTDEPIDALVGVLGLVEADEKVPTATGLASPIDAYNNYEPCFALRDWWTLSEADLVAWNESLATDEEVIAHLPLDEQWDVIGFVRTFTHSPEAIAGAKLSPLNASSNTVIRYLNEDGGTFNDNQTTSAGIFVLFGASLGETFRIEAPGMIPWNQEAVRSGVFPDALWVMPLWMIPN